MINSYCIIHFLRKHILLLTSHAFTGARHKGTPWQSLADPSQIIINQQFSIAYVETPSSVQSLGSQAGHTLFTIAGPTWPHCGQLTITALPCIGCCTMRRSLVTS